MSSPVDFIFSLDLIAMCLEQSYSYPPKSSRVIKIQVLWTLHYVDWCIPQRVGVVTILRRDVTARKATTFNFSGGLSLYQTFHLF